MNAARIKKLDNAIKLVEQAKGIVFDVAVAEKARFNGFAESYRKQNRGWEVEADINFISIIISDMEALVEDINAAKSEE